ncbi:MAG: WD40/YVTN/BNR-like repeat-containing protein, partial [Bacteroidota bacterium]
MKKIFSLILLSAFLILSSIGTFGQRNRTNSNGEESKNPLTESTFSAFKLRNIGPAFMSGRIADIAIHPEDDNLWYVAVGSGGVWKTLNAGVTWESIFDGQGSYSIGCLTIDPNNPHTIWVGTGENVGGRHVGYGDGIYKSEDGGATWKNMGLKKSEHISDIIVHPKNPDIIWVAAQGPLWSPGGERGVFKTTDGGETWTKLLGDDEYTGATEILIDPRNPDVLYAATWQHHRTVAAYMGGGPKTAIYKTTNGGDTWEKLEKGLPKGNMGKIG